MTAAQSRLRRRAGGGVLLFPPAGRPSGVPEFRHTGVDGGPVGRRLEHPRRLCRTGVAGTCRVLRHRRLHLVVSVVLARGRRGWHAGRRRDGRSVCPGHRLALLSPRRDIISPWQPSRWRRSSRSSSAIGICWRAPSVFTCRCSPRPGGVRLRSVEDSLLLHRARPAGVHPAGQLGDRAQLSSATICGRSRTNRMPPARWGSV